MNTKAPAFLFQAAPIVLEPAVLPLPAPVLGAPETADLLTVLAFTLGLAGALLPLLIIRRHHGFHLCGRKCRSGLRRGLQLTDGQGLCFRREHIRKAQDRLQARSHIHTQRRSC